MAAAQRLSFGGQRSTQESSDLFRGLGTLLFTQLIPDAIQQQLVTLPAGSTLQLVTDDLNWPWELLHDGQEFLALRHNVTRLPRLERSHPLRTHAAADKPAKVTCLLLGNPTSNLPGTEDEIAAIEDILFVARERVTYRSLFGPHITADYLQDQLTTEHYDLVHYAGHATPDALVLADAPFQMARLRAALRHHPVVILNACATAQAALVDADLATMSRNAQSLASGFMQAGAAAVIGMLWPIPDAAATRFGEVFYHHLTAGAPIGTALRLSRIELRRQDPHGIAWLAPVLYGNGQHQPVPVALKTGAGTVMAVRFVAPPVDQFQGGQRNAETLARSLALLAQRVTQYGGTLSQMTVAGLLATFGLHQPSDNSALNAIYAARDLATQLANWGVTPPAIALAAGDLATAAALGGSSSSSALARSSLLLGTAVREAEWAATLAASGQILINELVRE
ncbi:MAG: CHAT domain-containing protein, partial [Caldilineaceae bacterium]|nr:CHAT domain-containing protein [Caldilineaceae bacterium]